MAAVLHKRLPIVAAQVVWAVRQEMARTAEDVLARRTRALVLDAGAASEMAVAVAKLVAAERGLDGEWESRQVQEFRSLARKYQVG
jgi:glycerol-3-phosphate dehydrogenase